MNIQESKKIAEQLSGQEVIFEAIEGVYLEKEEIEDSLQTYLLEYQDEYLAYLNPVEKDKVVVHILGANEEILVSFLMLEDGSIEKIYLEEKQ